MATIKQVLKGWVLEYLTEERGVQDAIQVISDRDIRETTQNMHELYIDTDDNAVTQADIYGAVSSGDDNASIVDRTLVSHSFEFPEPSRISITINFTYLNQVGFDPSVLDADASGFSDAQILTMQTALQPELKRLLTKLNNWKRLQVITMFSNLHLTGSLPDYQKPFGVAPVALESAKTYYKYTNLLSASAIDTDENDIVHDLFASDQLDARNDAYMMSQPQILLMARGISKGAKIFQPEIVSDANTRSIGNLLDIAGKKMVGTYQDPTAANANDYIYIGPAAKIYRLAKNDVNGKSKQGMTPVIKMTDDDGLLIRIWVDSIMVVASDIDIVKNHTTIV